MSNHPKCDHPESIATTDTSAYCFHEITHGSCQCPCPICEVTGKPPRMSLEDELKTAAESHDGYAQTHGPRTPAGYSGVSKRSLEQSEQFAEAAREHNEETDAHLKRQRYQR